MPTGRSPTGAFEGFNSGPPMTPGAYNNNVQIVQTPGYVVIINEMVHNARIIPTDGRPHTTLRQWSGDSRGRWEGDTLVVETINFRRETSLQGSTADTRLVERFTRIDADTIKYEFTVTDPTAYTRPWTAMLPLSRIRGPLFEYACHEGNYALPNILAGARAQEKEQEKARPSREIATVQSLEVAPNAHPAQQVEGSAWRLWTRPGGAQGS